MIRAPHWAPGAVPTTRGWVNSKGELLKSQKISAQEIKEFYGEPEVTEEVKPKRKYTRRKPAPLNEAPTNDKSVEEMTDLERQNIDPSIESPTVLTEENKIED